LQGRIKDTFQILYVSSVDISKPDGPGVNEREFVGVLCETFRDRVRLILPRPEYTVELDPEVVSFIRPVRGIHGHFILQFEIFCTIRSVLSSKHFDLIVIRLGLLPLGLALYALTGNTPIALKTLGEATLRYLRQKKGFKGVVARIIRYPHQWMVRSIVSRAIGADACTPQLVERNRTFLGIDEGKIIHIDNATNTQRFYPIPKKVARKRTGLEGFDPIIGFVGGKPWERGGAQMIEATLVLVEKYPNIGCVIVGGRKGVERLKERAKELGVLDHCIFPGLVPYTDVPTWVNCFDVGVAFDLEDRMYYVGSSNQKIRQYIACGKPVIATPGGNPFLEEAGLGAIVQHNDIPGFVTALEKWLDRTEEEKEEHEGKAFKFAQRYLSVEKALADRIEFWSQRLQQSLQRSE